MNVGKRRIAIGSTDSAAYGFVATDAPVANPVSPQLRSEGERRAQTASAKAVMIVNMNVVSMPIFE